MRWLKKIRDLLVTQPLVRWPSDEFQTHQEAMIKVIETVQNYDRVYALFVASEHSRGADVTIIDTTIIVGNGEDLDLIDLIRATGESSIASRVAKIEDRDASRHVIDDASSHELAQIVDLIFRYHFHLSKDYRLEGFEDW